MRGLDGGGPRPIKDAGKPFPVRAPPGRASEQTNKRTMGSHTNPGFSGILGAAAAVPLAWLATMRRCVALPCLALPCGVLHHRAEPLSGHASVQNAEACPHEETRTSGSSSSFSAWPSSLPG